MHKKISVFLCCIGADKNVYLLKRRRRRREKAIREVYNNNNISKHYIVLYKVYTHEQHHRHILFCIFSIT